jgi:MYXO-CTERM domain-containing protein
MKPAITHPASRASATAAAGLLALAALVAAPRAASARATFVVNNLDPAGVGFNDPAPVSPVGGNTGTTLGQQRQIAFKYAADIWGKALDGPVPIVIDAKFAPLDCSGGLITLGHARPQTLVVNVPGVNPVPGLPPNVLYPQPLADQLAGVDLNPGVADIVATFNGGVLECSNGELDWYYGLDANAGSLSDLVEVVVHELGHGLGFTTGIDLNTGELNIGLPDTFSSHVYDNAMGMAWLDMTAQQRLASMRNVRHLVWTGTNAIRAAAQVLSKGAPTISTQSPVSAFLGNLGETNFGPLLKDATKTLTGPLVSANPIDACTPIASRPGGIFLIMGGSPCSPLNQAYYATSAGAIAVLLTDGNGFSPPSSVELRPSDLVQLPSSIPAAAISLSDGQALQSAGNVTITLGADKTRLTGADAMGRPYLYASDPVRPGSTVSHWDPLARPDLIQEPESGYEHPHDVTMETALMHDIGWPSLCGNSTMDTGEQCDNGSGNSDTMPDACRTDCSRAHCGDGVKDTGEACDLGLQNGASGSACSSTCMMVTPHPDAGMSMGGNGGGLGGASGGSGVGGAGGHFVPPVDNGKSGCSCGLGPSDGGPSPLLVALAVAGALASISRRRSRRR